MLWNLREAFRSILRRPGFSFAVILLLASGIALNAAFFTVFNSILLRALPYPKSEELFTIWEENAKEGKFKYIVNPANYTDWRSRSLTFQKMGAYLKWNLNFTGSVDPERISVALINGDFFDVLKVPALHGRTLMASDSENKANVAVLSYGFWQRHFGGDASVLGKSVGLSGDTYTVAGIMPKNFSFPDTEVQVWLPYGFEPEELTSRTGNYLRVIGRRKNETSPAEAQADLKHVAAQLAQQYSATNRDLSVRLIAMQEQQVEPARPMLRILFGAVTLVLLISCSNVANLLLARSTGRRLEYAIRAALGAGKWDLILLTLIEGMALSLIAGLLAMILLSFSMDALLALLPSELPRLHEIRLDASVVVFTLGISMLTGVLFSIAPALFQSKTDLRLAMDAGTRSTESGNVRVLRSLFVSLQIALAVVLLTGSLMLIRSLQNLQQVDLGFQLENRMTFRVWLSRTRYPENKAQIQFFQQLIERLQSIPEVERAGAIQDLPLRGNKMRFPVVISGKPVPPKGEENEIAYRTFAGDYFRVMGIPVLQGSAPSEKSLSLPTPVVWINQSAANAFWPGENPVGQSLRFTDEDRLLTVQGVVGDVKHMGATEQEGPAMYQPHSQKTFSFLSWMTLVVHMRPVSGNVLPAIREHLKQLDPQQPLFDFISLDQVFRDSTERSKFSTLLLSVFAVFAVLLACTGIYSVVQYSVAQRTREIGIRIALGAHRREVVRLLLKEGSERLAAGILSGLLLALLLGRFLQSLLFQVQPVDARALMLSVLLIGSAVVGATFFPAWRASRVDPLEALHYE